MKLDISAYCNKPVACQCGRTHFCPIQTVQIGRDALQKMPEILKNYRSIMLVADDNTWTVCDSQVADLLGNAITGIHIYHRSGHLIPDEQAVAELKAVLPSDVDLVLGIGSGVINDICKYTSWELGIECGIVATAPSMDGYASSGAAMIWDGMKVTFTAHPPMHIFADVQIIKDAPMDMIRAGYGDIIGKYSSLNDWKLANLITGEYFCQPIYDLVMEVTDCIRDRAYSIANRDEEAIELLMKALVLSGITLSLVGSTRPGSGSEHHFGHFFEVTGLVHGWPHFVHGIDVAYATVLTAGMRHCLCQAPMEFSPDTEPERLAAWRRCFGVVADEVQRLQEKAGFYRNNRFDEYAEKWDDICRILQECPTAAQCKSMLEAVGLDIAVFEAKYDAQRITDAMLYSKDLKDRYSFLWIYYAVFSSKKESVEWKTLLHS